MSTGCDGKIRWPSRKLATENMRRHLLKIRIRGKRASLNVYRCDACGGFHVGNNDATRPERLRQQDRPRCKRVEHTEEDAA